MISSRIQQSLYSTVLHKGILREYASKLNISDSVLQEITHWTALHKARKEANLSLKIFMTKWASGDTATGKVMVFTKTTLTCYLPKVPVPRRGYYTCFTMPKRAYSSTKTKYLSRVKGLAQFSGY